MKIWLTSIGHFLVIFFYILFAVPDNVNVNENDCNIL